jgi:group I intron endonuclease
MITSGIYKITNQMNNQYYIGSSSSLFSRRNQHFSLLRRGIHTNKYLQRSVNKHGINNFDFEVMFYCDKENLLFYEQICIDKLNPKYNLSPGVVGTYGYSWTKESRKKLSKSMLKRFSNPDEIEKLRTSHLGYIPTEEQKRKISEALKGRKRSPEVVEKIRKAHTGLKRSIEARENMSSGRKGMKFSDEHKKNISIGNMGKVVSSETSQKLSKSVSDYYTNLAKQGKMKSYTILSPDGVEYKNVCIIRRFAIEHELHPASLLKAVTGYYKQYKGWTGYLE